MKRKLIVVSMILTLTTSMLTACGNNEKKYMSTTTSSSTTSYYNSSSSDSYSSTVSKTKETYSHYCDEDGCSKEGIRTITGISGATEYYCQEHYNEIMDMIGKMEEDVGKGTASSHTCEACDKEGTHSVEGFGGTEWYCTEHYNEMVEALAEILKDTEE